MYNPEGVFKSEIEFYILDYTIQNTNFILMDYAIKNANLVNELLCLRDEISWSVGASVSVVVAFVMFKDVLHI